MSDDKSDPWSFLANELGVDATNEPPPPPPPPPAKSYQPPAAPPAPKRQPADWNLVAGELGLEVPPEPDVSAKKVDPVAELLGWPSSSSSSRPVEEPESVRYVDDDLEIYDSRRDRSSRSESRYDRPTKRDEWNTSDEIVEVDRERDEMTEEEPFGASSPSARGPDDRTRDDADRSRSRRRRRGGRGRGRDRRDEPREFGDSAGEPSESIQELGGEPSFGEELAPSEPSGDEGVSSRDQDSRGRRRRRGRRGGRGRGEDRGTRRTEGQHPDSEPNQDDLGIEDQSLPGEDEFDDAIEPAESRSHGGKSSVRDICTWKEAIGMIIDHNMQSRSRNPQSSGGGGGRGGHHRGGRGRGRRGN